MKAIWHNWPRHMINALPQEQIPVGQGAERHSSYQDESGSGEFWGTCAGSAQKRNSMTVEVPWESSRNWQTTRMTVVTPTVRKRTNRLRSRLRG